MSMTVTRKSCVDMSNKIHQCAEFVHQITNHFLMEAIINGFWSSKSLLIMQLSVCQISGLDYTAFIVITLSSFKSNVFFLTSLTYCGYKKLFR